MLSVLSEKMCQTPIEKLFRIPKRSLTVAGPVLYPLFAGQSADPLLTTWKAWLVANNATVKCILLLVLGAALIGEGLGGVIE